MSKASRKKSTLQEKPVAQPEPQAQAAPSQMQQQQDNILQLSAQFSSAKQLVDELVNANIGLRSNMMIQQHNLTSAQAVNSSLEGEKTAFMQEIAILKQKVSELEEQIHTMDNLLSEYRENEPNETDDGQEDDQEAAA